MRAGNGNLAEMEPFTIDSILQMRKLAWDLERLSLLPRLTSLLTSTRLGFHPCWPFRRLSKASSRPNTTVTVSALSAPGHFQCHGTLAYLEGIARVSSTLCVSWRLPKGSLVSCLALKEESRAPERPVCPFAGFMVLLFVFSKTCNQYKSVCVEVNSHILLHAMQQAFTVTWTVSVARSQVHVYEPQQ